MRSRRLRSGAKAAACTCLLVRLHVTRLAAEELAHNNAPQWKHETRALGMTWNRMFAESASFVTLHRVGYPRNCSMPALDRTVAEIFDGSLEEALVPPASMANIAPPPPLPAALYTYQSLRPPSTTEMVIGCVHECFDASVARLRSH